MATRMSQAIAHRRGHIEAMANAIDDPKHWRDRAAEARRLAETVASAEARATLLEIALGYERLARRAEERADGRKGGPPE